MVPTKVVLQIGHGVADPIADNPGKTDLPCESEITQPPGMEVEKFGCLVLGNGYLAVDEMIQIGHLVQHCSDYLLNHGTKFISMKLKFRHTHHAQGERSGLGHRGPITYVA